MYNVHQNSNLLIAHLLLLCDTPGVMRTPGAPMRPVMPEVTGTSGRLGDGDARVPAPYLTLPNLTLPYLAYLTTNLT